MRAGALLRRERALPVGGRGRGRGAAAQPLRRARRARAPRAVARRRRRALQQDRVSTAFISASRPRWPQNRFKKCPN